jgi:hypothetical protein
MAVVTHDKPTPYSLDTEDAVKLRTKKRKAKRFIYIENYTYGYLANI